MDNYATSQACENYAKAVFGFHGFRIFEAPESHPIDFLIQKNSGQYYGIQVKSSSRRTDTKTFGRYLFSTRRKNVSFRKESTVVAETKYASDIVHYFVFVANDLFIQNKPSSIILPNTGYLGFSLEEQDFIRLSVTWDDFLKKTETQEQNKNNTGENDNPVLELNL